MYPFAYIASATGRGGRWENSLKDLADDLLAGGFKRVLLMDRYARPDQVKYLKSRGLVVGGWDEPFAPPAPDGNMYHVSGPNQTRFLEMGYDGFVLQTETPAQRDLALKLYQDGFAVGSRKEIVTYYYGFDDGSGPATLDKFRAAGVMHVQAECYKADGHTDAASYVAHGRALLDAAPGEVINLFGTYRNEIPGDYTNTADIGPEFGVFIVDNWPDAATGDPDRLRWKAWGGLNRVSLLTYWQVRDLKTGGVLHEERAITYSPTGGFGGGADDGRHRTLQWIHDNLATLSASGDWEIVRVQY